MAMAADEPSQSGTASVLNLVLGGTDVGAMLDDFLNPVTSTTTGPVPDGTLDFSALTDISTPPLPIIGSIGIIGPDDGTNLLGISGALNSVLLNPGGASAATSDIAGLSVNATQLLSQIPGLSAVFSTLNLSVGALTATTSDDGSNTSGLTSLANLGLEMASPAVKTISGLTTGITDAIQPMVDTLSSALGALGPLGAPQVNVDIAGAMNQLLNEPIEAYGVTINPGTGELSFDLGELLGDSILDPDPNTDLFSAANINKIAESLAKAMDSLAAALINKIQDVIGDNISVSFTPTAVGGLKGEVTLGQLLGTDPTPMDLVGCGPTLPFIGQTCVLPVGPILDVATTPLQAVAQTLPTLVESVVDAAVTPVVNAISPALNLLDSVISVELNKQTTNPDGSMSTQGMQLDLLGGAVASIGLANTTLSAARAPVLEATTPVQAGGTTNITGDLFTPGETVTLTLQCPAGTPVTGAVIDPATQTVAGDGTFSAKITVPQGTTPGECQVVASTPADGTFTTPLTVTPQPTVEQPGPISVGADTTTTGTGFTPGTTPTVTPSDEDVCTARASEADDDGNVTITITGADGADGSVDCTITVTDSATTAPALPVTADVLQPNTPYIWWTNEDGETTQYVRYTEIATLNGTQFDDGAGSGDRGEVHLQTGSEYIPLSEGGTDLSIGRYTDETTDDPYPIVQAYRTGDLDPILFRTDGGSDAPVNNALQLLPGAYTAIAYSYPSDTTSNQATLIVFAENQTLDAPDAPAGGTSTVTGDGFAIGEPVSVVTTCIVTAEDPDRTVTWTTNTTASSKTVDNGDGTTSEIGPISVPVAVPSDLPAGTSCTVEATGVSGANASDGFTVTDAPTIEPDSAGPGVTTLPIAGDHFTPEGDVTVTVTYTVMTDPNNTPDNPNDDVPRTVTVPGCDQIVVPASETGALTLDSCVIPTDEDGRITGPYKVTAVDEGTGLIATGTVNVVNPQITNIGPDTIPVTGTVTTDGTGFTPGQPVTVTIGDPEDPVCTATVNADASGNISIPCLIPPSEEGLYDVSVTDTASGTKLPGGQIEVTPPPSITVIDPTTVDPETNPDGTPYPDGQAKVPAGGTITVVCDQNFMEGETVTVNVYAKNTDGSPNTSKVIATGTCTPDADAPSGGTATVTVPPGTGTGTYTIIATGDDSGATAPPVDLTVTQAPTITVADDLISAGGEDPIDSTGTGFTPGGDVTVTVTARVYDDKGDDDPSNDAWVTQTICGPETVTADATGAVSSTCDVLDDAPAGTYTVTATDVTGATATDTLRVANPAIESPITVPAGSNPTLYGTGWFPDEDVTITVTCELDDGTYAGEFTGTTVGEPAEGEVDPFPKVASSGSVGVPVQNLADDMTVEGVAGKDGLPDGLPGPGTCEGVANGTVLDNAQVPVTIIVTDAPTISTLPQTAGPGTTVPVTGDGYTPNTLAVVQLTNDNGTPDDMSDDIPVGDPIFVPVDGDGHISTKYTIPVTYDQVYPEGECVDNGDGTTTCTTASSNGESVETVFDTESCTATGTTTAPTTTCTTEP